MKKIIQLIVTTLFFSQINAQVIKEKKLSVSIGYGLTFPYYDDIDIANSGFFAQGEYVLKFSNWISLRPYAGVLFTKSNGKDIKDNPTVYESTANALLIGGKGRLTFPIPYVAPYLESGLGASIGNFKTITPKGDSSKSGMIRHIPFTLGLAVGRKHNVDIAFTYYYQPTVNQIAGAIAFGYTIPLD
ncbi:hypothetical protein [Flavobacterium faecale]|uniref:hypothetical protein n=1 Tax=Flavobacterium faecale TaxID=1355330 RepID=UPI003AAFB877